jgi:predicted  nucleic acid-binding Zn-ribbon protein
MRLKYNKAVLWSEDMNEKPKPGTSLNTDVQVIRDILLGEHFEKFQTQIDALEKEIDLLKKENKTLLKQLDAGVDKRFQDLAVRLEQVVGEQAESTAGLRSDFDAQLKEISRRLLAYEDRQGGLIASLASALMEYRNKSGK